MHEQAKDADKLEPKGNVDGTGAEIFPVHGQSKSTGEKEAPNPLVGQ